MQMMDIRDRLRKDLAIAMKAHADQLSSGRAADYAAYQRQVGVIKGLQDAIDVIDQVFKLILDEEDEK